MLVTHDMGVIAETADRVAVMYAGASPRSGRCAMSWSRRHPYTRADGLDPELGGAKTGTQIDGAMPRLTEIPRGCAFNRAAPERGRCRVRAARLDVRPAASRAACWLVRCRGVGAPRSGDRRCLTARPASSSAAPG